MRVLENGLEDYPALVAAAERLPQVREVAPPIGLLGLVSNGLKSAAYMGTAVDPAATERRKGASSSATATLRT